MFGGIGDAIKSVGQAISSTVTGAINAVADVLPGAAKVTAAYLTAKQAAEAVISGTGTVQVTQAGQTYTVGQPLAQKASPVVFAGVGLLLLFLLFRKRG